MKTKTSTLLFVLLMAGHPGFAQKVTEMDFKAQFSRYGVDGCFVLYDPAINTYFRYNSSLCDTGYIPASTFKIPNSIIFLEEGIIKDTNQIIPWDGHEWPNKNWNHDQDLRTAMKYSCVWVYTSFAEKVGTEKYNQYIQSFDYGNRNITGMPNRFWLAGLLRISANQQVDFLKKFYNYELPVSRRSIDMVKDVLVLEKSGSWKFSGKTGGGMLNDTDYVMWLVGYLERDGKPYFYAMNFITNDFDKTSQARYDIVKEILKELKLME